MGSVLKMTLLSLTVICPFAWAKMDVKSDTLLYLQGLRNHNVQRLREIDQSLSAKMDELQNASLENEVDALKQARREYSLRQEFLDRLIFQVDTKFRDGDLRIFFERALVDMAKVDLASRAESDLWKFLKYAADALRRLPDQKENILAFIEGYMNRSVSHPIRPEDYLSSRNYTNGVKSETGSPLSREEVGAIADRRLLEMQSKPPVRQQ